MILKQNITKPMIENIEIDVPKKGAHLNGKPSVEVIEGKRKEMLNVTRGQAILPDTSAQVMDKTTKPEQTSASAVQPGEYTSTHKYTFFSAIACVEEPHNLLSSLYPS